MGKQQRGQGRPSPEDDRLREVLSAYGATLERLPDPGVAVVLRPSSPHPAGRWVVIAVFGLLLVLGFAFAALVLRGGREERVVTEAPSVTEARATVKPDENRTAEPTVNLPVDTEPMTIVTPQPDRSSVGSVVILGEDATIRVVDGVRELTDPIVLTGPPGFEPQLLSAIGTDALVKWGPEVFQVDTRTGEARLVGEYEVPLVATGDRGVMWGATLNVDHQADGSTVTMTWHRVNLEDGTVMVVSDPGPESWPVASFDGDSLIVSEFATRTHRLLPANDLAGIDIPTDYEERIVAATAIAAYSITRDGELIRRRFTELGLPSVIATLSPSLLSYTGSASLSPSGSILALLTKFSERHKSSTLTLVDLADESGSAVVDLEISQPTDLRWSLDGTWLLVTHSAGGHTTLQAVSSDGTRVVEVATDALAAAVLGAEP